MSAKLRQRDIRDLIRSGGAVDLSELYRQKHGSEWYEFIRSLQLDEVGASYGTYGVNGAVFLSLAEGRLYADCRRDAALFTVI